MVALASDESDIETEQPDWYEERQEYIRHASERGWPYWRVICTLDCRTGEQIFGAHAPHRAGAKQRVAELLDDECTVTDWGRAYIPRASWDCPSCRTHEAMTSVPNMRGKWDWECTCCSYRTVGHPQDPEQEVSAGGEADV